MKVTKILIIDDDASVRECYGRLFRREGYDARLESGGASVERNLEEHRDAGVVILDYRMPGMDGLELIRRLRRRDFTAPGVMVTAFATAEILEEAGRLGIRRVFSKPVNVSQLLQAVRDSLLPRAAGGGGDDGDERE